MVRRCVVGGCCNVDIPLHTWTAQEPQAAAWKKFVDSTREDFIPSRYSHVCCLHFDSSSFENLFAWKHGFGYLKLAPTAVPSIQNCMDNPLKDDVLKVAGAGGKDIDCMYVKDWHHVKDQALKLDGKV